MATVEPTWEELLGSKEWEGLLDPLNLNLRKLIIRCGEFNEVAGDGFNNDTNSKYLGTCRYGMQSLLKKVYLPSASDYQVVAYIYATANADQTQPIFPPGAWDNHLPTNWMGYIAVTTDDVSKANGRREIYITWRGTLRRVELEDDTHIKLVSAKPLLGSGDNSYDAKISEGWLQIYTTDNPDYVFAKTSARTQLLTKIKELLNQYKEEALSLVFTGHSLGAVLATLCAFDVAENVTTDIPIVAFVFAMPMLGNKAFCDKIKARQNLQILHVKNTNDIVPKLPFLPSFPQITVNQYVTVGTELVVDSGKSPDLKIPQNDSEKLGIGHNLHVLLHTVAGWNGKDEKFELKVKRCLALVNKASNYLINKYQVPESWWIEKNRGMELDENGNWVLSDPFQEDEPVPQY